MKKNILIISYAYPPNNVAGAQRPYALAKYLDKTKYNIKVITCENPDLPIGNNPDFNPNLESVELIKIKSRIDGESTKKIRKNADFSNNKTISFKSILIKIAQKFIFPDKAMFWYPNVKTFLFQNKQIIENTDIVFSTSPGVTNHQIARLIKRKNSKVKWIADFRDFNFVDVWEHEQGIKALRHKKLEASIISESTYLTFVTKTMQLNYQKFYLKHKDKMHCVFNGFDLMDFSQFEEKVIDTKKITIFYAGSFYGGIRSPFPLMELIEKALINEVINKNDIEVLIAGSIEDTMIAELKKLSSFDCIKFLGSIPRTNVIEYMSNSTFLWLIVGNLKSHYQTIPIKLFEYIASRRPIINFAPNISECTSIIYEKKLGYSFNTLDFNLEDSYKDFEKLIKSAKIGEFSQSLSTENVNYFLWDKQIKSIEKLF